MPNFSARFQTTPYPKTKKINCTNKHLQPKLKSQTVYVSVRERERERAVAFKDTTLNLSRGVHGQSVRIPGLVAIENYQIQIQI